MTNHIFIESGTKVNISLSESKSMVDIDFLEEMPLLGSERVLTLNFGVDEFKSMYYRMHRFMTENFFEKRERKEEQPLCIITNATQAKLFATDTQTMSKFLRSLTETDAGLSKKESETDSYLTDNGDTTDNISISQK